MMQGGEAHPLHFYHKEGQMIHSIQESPLYSIVNPRSIAFSVRPIIFCEWVP